MPHASATGSGEDGAIGEFKSQVAGLGPQLGRFFEAGGRKCYVNLKGYWEFSAKNRAEGWDFWLALAIPLSEKK